MPTKFECMSLVCRMVKVFFPSAAAAGCLDSRIVAPMAAAPAMNSRREIDSSDAPAIVSMVSWTAGAS
jgi:hypothetical protein